MSEVVVKKRIDQVRDMISKGIHTKQEIADTLNVKPGGVSSQMTYLRWQGNFIATEAETKILSFVDEETFEEMETERKANSKSKSAVSKKTPDEQAVAMAKTIKTQTKQLDNWSKKAAEYTTDQDDDDAPVDIEDLIAEADANVVLLEIKIKRNIVKADALPDLEAAQAAIDAANVEDAEDAEPIDSEDDNAVDVEEGEESDLL